MNIVELLNEDSNVGVFRTNEKWRDTLNTSVIEVKPRDERSPMGKCGLMLKHRLISSSNEYQQSASCNGIMLTVIIDQLN